MLYKKTEKLSRELFENPTAEYRGTPFWAWNCKMTTETIDNTLKELREMGMGGGHIHSRTGLANEYLGEEFMSLVKYTKDEAIKANMLTWLYDEDRWPSGAGGGYVTKDEKFRIRFLVLCPISIADKKRNNTTLSSSGQAVRADNRTLLARYEVKLADGYLEEYRRLGEGEKVKEGYKEWLAYQEISGDNPWFNNQAYLNTLDKKAVEKFVEVTHKRYFEELGKEFGGAVPAIFTDEPQFTHKTRLGFAEEEKEIIIPYTDDLEETFTRAYGHSLLDALPELFWELGGEKFSVTRYEYHDHICERFASAFADTIGSWCEQHGIMLTGHMMEEPTLSSQTAALGEAMRSYRSFQLPGIDMLCDSRELSTAKQAQSASHQFGRPGVLSELYGVTNWDFDFRGHKLQGDWQAALGVTVRVPHLTWTSMAGEAKRDYPASIGYQSPWYKEYSYIENYFSRLNTALTRGKAEVKVGILHPIESYWLYWGTDEQTGGIRKEMDENFDKIIRWALFGLIDFDFIAESLLPDLTKECRVADGKLLIGEMAYEVIVVPNFVTIRGTTLDILEEFRAAGGKIIFTGEAPILTDARPSDRGTELAAKCTVIPFNRHKLLNELKPYRDLDVKGVDGNRTENIIYQMRKDGENQWLFLAHVNKMVNPDIPKAENIKISIRGAWKITWFDALTGEIKDIRHIHKEGSTVIQCEIYEHDSLLLYLEPVQNKTFEPAYPAAGLSGSAESRRVLVPERVPVKLSEPNVYILDLAEYRFDEGEWQSREEVLRIDNQFRDLLGYPLRMEAFAQPWVNKEEEPYSHKLSLRFAIPSKVDVEHVQLAVENGRDITAYLNGEKLPGVISGWYADRDIDVMELAGLKAGINELIVEIPYRAKQNVEWMYLLGDFGVTVAGSEATIVGPVRALSFGDITCQGLPFYGGNVAYEIETETDEGALTMQVSRFRNPLLKVAVDGKEAGQIAFSPYCLNLGDVSKGKHTITLTAFGNRINTFGTLHNCNWTETWFGPNAWRTEGTSWAYEYQLRQTGVLNTPVLKIK